jgi:cupin fold WbuC family metalloprotein
MVHLDERAIDDLVARAASAPRRRLNLNLHASPTDPIQRFLNAGAPGSYVRPHRHAAARWELFTALRGRIEVILFDDAGAVTHRHRLEARTGELIEIPGGTWHSFVFALPGSVALEVKPGPYIAASDKQMAAWAPDESAASAPACAAWLETAAPGATWRGV